MCVHLQDLRRRQDVTLPLVTHDIAQLPGAVVSQHLPGVHENACWTRPCSTRFGLRSASAIEQALEMTENQATFSTLSAQFLHLLLMKMQVEQLDFGYPVDRGIKLPKFGEIYRGICQSGSGTELFDTSTHELSGLSCN